MEILLGIIIAIGWIIFVIVLRSFTTLIHELGHAIPALYFTNKKVQVFVGTYGSTEKCLKLLLPGLEIYFKIDFLGWDLGMCRHQEVKNLWKNVWIVLGGPVASLMIALITLVLIYLKDSSEEFLAIGVGIIIASLLDFFVNIYPDNNPINSDEGGAIYNDGYQILYLLKRMKMPKEFHGIEEKFTKGLYSETIMDCRKLIEQNLHQKEIYYLMLESFLELKEFDKAIDVYKEMANQHKLDYIDFYIIGGLYSKVNDKNEAIKYYNQYLYKYYNDSNALGQRGDINFQLGNYQSALDDLNAAIYYSSGIGELYCKRGLILLKMGNLEEGYADLLKSKELDGKNPLIPYSLGIYYEEKNDLENALKHYLKAKEMNIDYHGINFKIDTIERKIDSRS